MGFRASRLFSQVPNKLLVFFTNQNEYLNTDTY